MLMISLPEERRFFRLGDILEAFVFTYEKLLKGRVPRQMDGFFNKCF
jgi:hypothetical protein